MDDKELINNLKFLIENASFKNPDIERGFVAGIFYVTNVLEYGWDYANHKVDWDGLGRTDTPLF